MEVITAIEEGNRPGKIKCFLGGGITNCAKWQDEVIRAINNSDEDTSNLVLYNPRRKNFPIDDPNASKDQVKWEFDWLSAADIFTMYFCNTEKSDQPICFYELGRYVTKMMYDHPDDYISRIIVSCEDGFRRKADVIYQLHNIHPGIEIDTAGTPEDHASRIITAHQLINK